jgi:hypothetical protein
MSEAEALLTREEEANAKVMMRYTHEDGTAKDYVLRNLASPSWRNMGQHIFHSEARTKAFIRANRDTIRMYAMSQHIFSDPIILPDDILYRLKRLDAKVSEIEAELRRPETTMQCNVEQANAVFYFLKSLSPRDLRVLDEVIQAYIKRGGYFHFNADNEPVAAFAQRIRHKDVYFIELRNCMAGMYENSLERILQWQEMLRLIYMDVFGGMAQRRQRKRRSSATKRTPRRARKTVGRRSRTRSRSRI